MEVKQIGNCMKSGKRDNPNQGRVYDDKGLCPTLTDMQGGGRQPMVVEDIIIGGMQEHQSIKTDGVCTCLTSSMGAGGGYVPMIPETIEPVLIGGLGEKKSNNGTQYYQQDRVYSMDGVAMCHPSQIPDGSYKYLDTQYRIRKLTPKECWRLMNFSDKNFSRVAEVNSPTQLYKQAGNSIVRNVLVAIIGQMLPGKENIYKEV